MLSGIWVSQKHILESKSQKDSFNYAATRSKMKKYKPQTSFFHNELFLELFIVEPCYKVYWQSFNISYHKISLFI